MIGEHTDSDGLGDKVQWNNTQGGQHVASDKQNNGKPVVSISACVITA